MVVQSRSRKHSVQPWQHPVNPDKVPLHHKTTEMQHYDPSKFREHLHSALQVHLPLLWKMSLWLLEEE